MTEIKERNLSFTVLSFVGIVLVMLGHLGWNVLDVWGLFPYYSFHVLLFVFISGYFYKTEDEDDILAYMKRKSVKLLIPYFLWNLVYGIIILLLEKAGFVLGNRITFGTLFIEPFVSGHQFGLNSPAWFVPALVLLEICNIIARKILKKIHLDNEYLIMVGYLAVGLLAIYLSKRGSIYDYYRIPGRVMFMAPILQFGRIYRCKLENKIDVPGVVKIAIILILNLILVKTQAGLNYSTAWVNGFAPDNLIVTPYISTITGILFWLEISKLLTKVCSIKWIKTVIEYAGRHTFDIMMHHLAGFFVLNLCLWQVGVALFNEEKFTYDVYYSWCPEGCEWFKILYVIAGIALALGIAKVKEKICGLQIIGKTIRS